MENKNIYIIVNIPFDLWKPGLLFLLFGLTIDNGKMMSQEIQKFIEILCWYLMKGTKT